jgi:hypothetical protein
MHSLKTDGADFAGIADATVLRIGQLSYAGIHGNSVVRYALRHLGSIRTDLDKATTLGCTDSLYTSTSELSLVGHVEQSILETCRT